MQVLFITNTLSIKPLLNPFSLLLSLSLSFLLLLLSLSLSLSLAPKTSIFKHIYPLLSLASSNTSHPVEVLPSLNTKNLRSSPSECRSSTAIQSPR
jgi:hypothetical protein